MWPPTPASAQLQGDPVLLSPLVASPWAGSARLAGDPDTFTWTLQLSPRLGNLLGAGWLAGHWLTPSLLTVVGEGRH